MTDERKTTSGKERNVLKVAGTRNAVETAIDLAKSDHTKTWEYLVAESPSQVPQWESLTGDESTIERVEGT